MKPHFDFEDYPKEVTQFLIEQKYKLESNRVFLGMENFFKAVIFEFKDKHFLVKRFKKGKCYDESKFSYEQFFELSKQKKFKRVIIMEDTTKKMVKENYVGMIREIEIDEEKHVWGAISKVGMGPFIINLCPEVDKFDVMFTYYTAKCDKSLEHINYKEIVDKHFNQKLYDSVPITLETLEPLFKDQLKEFIFYNDDPYPLWIDEPLGDLKYTIYAQTLAVLDEHKEKVKNLPQFFINHEKLFEMELGYTEEMLRLMKEITRAKSKYNVRTQTYRVKTFIKFISLCLKATRKKKYLDILYKLWTNSGKNNKMFDYKFCGSNKCQVCGEEKDPKYCGACRMVIYCSKEHQLEDWGVHKKICMNYK